jgi:hypothetical protein
VEEIVIARGVVNIRAVKRHEYDVYIGRGSKWGNPFVIGQDGNREEVIAKYEEYFLGDAYLQMCLPELEDKILGCYCTPAACHGDILERYANG